MNRKDILLMIKNEPEKYLGEISLEKLHFFVLGYIDCLEQNNMFEYCDKYEKFNIYIQLKYNMIISLNSESIIGFFSENDEEAFYNYFRELEVFEKLSDAELEKLTYENLTKQ